MRVSIIFILFLLVGFIGCQSQKGQEHTYLRMIGDILHDETQDDTNFELCQGDKMAIQYYALGEKTYEGEKVAIERIFEKEYNSDKVPPESGLLRIRFLVNCKGESGRFRMISMDEEYAPKTFDSSITDQLMSITKSLDGWKQFTFRGVERDYYQYLIFKIKEGKIIEIMP